MSSPAATAESSHPVLALLQDKSADPNHLFQALTAVEKGLPELLLCLKPILAQLGSSPSGTLGEGGRSGGSEGPSGPSEADGGDGGARAKRAVVDFLAILDEIQDTLRQSTLVLRTLKASPSTLIPPPPGSIPTPFASTLPSAEPSQTTQTNQTNQAELGLYASRIEAKTLGEIRDVLRDWTGQGGEGMVLDH